MKKISNKFFEKIFTIIGLNKEYYFRYFHSYSLDNTKYEYREKIVEFFIGREFKPSSILDYGCGDGGNYGYLRRLFSDAIYYAYDVDKLALKKFKDNSRNCNVVFLNKIDKNITIELLILDQVCCYLSEKTLREIVRKVKPKIIFIHDFNIIEGKSKKVHSGKYWAHNFSSIFDNYRVTKESDDIRLIDGMNQKWNSFILLEIDE